MADGEQGNEDDFGLDGAELGPRARLMQEAAAQMDAIEAQLGGEFEIGAVATIVEVRTPDGDSNLRFRCVAPIYVQVGLLQAALMMVQSQMGAQE